MTDEREMAASSEIRIQRRSTIALLAFEIYLIFARAGRCVPTTFIEFLGDTLDIAPIIR